MLVGLLSALEQGVKDSSDCNLASYYHSATAAGQHFSSATISASKIAFDKHAGVTSHCVLAEKSGSSVGTVMSRVSRTSLGERVASAPLDRVDRKVWKPGANAALPAWERPAEVLGVDYKKWRPVERKLLCPASPRHLE